MSREWPRQRNGNALEGPKDHPPLFGRAISLGRDRMQSELLVGAMGMLLAVKVAVEIVRLHTAQVPATGFISMPPWFWASCGFSAGFALLVRMLRAATGPAALMGGLVCLNILMRQELGMDWRQTAMPSLLALFVLTFAATRFGRSRKEAMGTAETRGGRRASQVAANLGVAGILAAGGAAGTMTSRAMLAAAIAALAEATADTVSSEAGQALSGTSWPGMTLLITTGRPVPPGTDGGVSVWGTVIGSLAAAVVGLLVPFDHAAGLALCVFASACAGLLLDSLLGATLERRGWLGNDLVNFVSTIVAAVLAFCAAVLIG